MARSKSSNKESAAREGTGTLSIRFSPKLRYQIELAGRLERRSLSNFIEDCVYQALKNKPWPGFEEEWSTSSPEAWAVGEFIEVRLWDVEQADRIAKLGINAPSLLDYEEQRIWKLITELPDLWQGQKNKFGLPEKPYRESDFDFIKLRVQWETIVKIAKGELKKDVLNSLKIANPTKGMGTTLDEEFGDDIPF